MSEDLGLILFILAVGGILGGMAAFLSRPTFEGKSVRGSLNTDRLAPLSSYLLLGLAAAGCVPLFLSLLKSGLVNQILSNGHDNLARENCLILLGLAVIFGYSSRQFLRSISDQLLRRIEQTQRTAEEATERAADAKVIATEVALEIEGADEERTTRSGRVDLRTAAPAPLPDLEPSHEPDAGDGERHGGPKLDPLERKVLKSLTLMSRRTATGIAEDSGISRMRIGELLDSLADKGLVVPTVSPKTGGARWQITPAGAARLAASVG